MTREMVKERHEQIMTGGLDGKNAAPVSANAAMVTLRIPFNSAADEYRRPDEMPMIARNPVGALKHHCAKLGSRTERYIDKGNVGAVWNKLNESRQNPKNWNAIAEIDLTILHGPTCRSSRCG